MITTMLEQIRALLQRLHEVERYSPEYQSIIRQLDELVDGEGN